MPEELRCDDCDRLLGYMLGWVDNDVLCQECLAQHEGRWRAWIAKNPSEAFVLAQARLDEMSPSLNGLVIRDIFNSRDAKKG